MHAPASDVDVVRVTYSCLVRSPPAGARGAAAAPRHARPPRRAAAGERPSRELEALLEAAPSAAPPSSKSIAVPLDIVQRTNAVRFDIQHSCTNTVHTSPLPILLRIEASARPLAFSNGPIFIRIFLFGGCGLRRRDRETLGSLAANAAAVSRLLSAVHLRDECRLE